jgi:hypothetical protein
LLAKYNRSAGKIDKYLRMNNRSTLGWIFESSKNLENTIETWDNYKNKATDLYFCEQN